MGVSQKVAVVREGDRAQLDCQVSANPAETDFGWTFNNGQLLVGSDNVVMSNSSLVIMRATRYESGKYHCWAANDEGRTLSNMLQLDVHCKAQLTLR